MVVDECMATVFNCLSLKRKAPEDLDLGSGHPKLIKGEEKSLISVGTKNTFLSGLANSSQLRVRGSSRSKGKNIVSSRKNIVNFELFEVRVLAEVDFSASAPSPLNSTGHVSAKLEDCCSQVPSTFPSRDSDNGNSWALVADPKQPQSPCSCSTGTVRGWGET